MIALESIVGYNKGMATPSLSPKKCFKCHGFGHIALECPNRKVITFIEEKEGGEEEKVAQEYEIQMG